MTMEEEEIKPEKKPEKKEGRRKHIVRELVETEKIFAEQMSLFVERVVVPMREEKVLNINESRTLFSNIETIAMVAVEMHVKLSEIEELPEEEQNFGEFFIKMIPVLKSYSFYCSNSHDSDNMRAKLEKTNNQYNYFVKIQYDSKAFKLGPDKVFS